MHGVLCFALNLLVVQLAGCSNEPSVSHSATQSRSNFIERDGVTLRHFREGSGPPSVVVGSSTYYPRAFSAALRRHLDLIFADGRHFAASYDPSDSGLESLTLESWSDDVETLRRSVGIEWWIVIGHSIHSQIALDYARKFPDAVDRLVLIAGVPYAGADSDQAVQELWDTQATEQRKARHEFNLQGL